MAVFTSLSQQDIQNFLELYQIYPPFDYKGVEAGIQNTTYIIEKEDKKWILTVYETGDSLENIQFFLDYMHYLRDHGLPCPQTYQDQKGQMINFLHRKPAILVEFLNGKEVIYPNIPSLEHTIEASKSVGQMHKTAMHFNQVRPDHNDRIDADEFQKLWNKFQKEETPETIKYRDIIEETLTYFKTIDLNSSTLPQAVVHRDLFPDNFLFSRNELIGIIDFNFSADDSLLLDFCIFYNAWAFDAQHQCDPEKHHAIFEEYMKQRPFTESEKKALPFYMQMTSMRFILYRLEKIIYKKSTDFYQPKNPQDYVDRLAFHRQKTSFKDYYDLKKTC